MHLAGLLDLLYGAIGAAAVLTGTWFTPWAKRRRARTTRQDEFQRDWFGQPPRPGVDAVPGVMERLAALDKRTSSPLLNGKGEQLLQDFTRLGAAVRRLDSRTARQGREISGIRRVLDGIPAQRTPSEQTTETRCE